MIMLFLMKKSSCLKNKINVHLSQVKTVQNTSKQMLVDFDVRGQQGMDFFTGGRIIMDCPEATV